MNSQAIKLLKAKRILCMSVATALTVIFIPSIVRAQCGVISVPDSVTLRPGQSLSIRLFEFPSHQHEEYELFKKLPLTIAERLTATLQETKHFGSVETLLAGNPAQTDYVLEGRFVSLTATSSIPYLFVSEKLIGMAVQLQIRKPGAAQPMVELACLREKQTGLFGSEKKVVRRVAEMLVTDLGQLIPNITKELSLTASSDRSPTINAATQAMPDWWLYHPPKHWSSRRWKRSLRRDPTSITITGSAASPIEPSATVVAIWLTHENVLTALAGDRLTMIIKQYSEQKARGMATHDRKMAAVGEIYNALESDDQYFIWIWFAKRGPVFWRPDRTAAATFLRHHDALAERIQPLRFWISPTTPRLPAQYLRPSKKGYWSYHSMIFAFPLKHENGDPLISSLKEKVELHTIFEGRPVVVHFDLSKFGLRKLDELNRR